MASKKYGLGRGLSSLIPQKNADEGESMVEKPKDNLGFTSKHITQDKKIEKKVEKTNNSDQGVKEIPIGNILANEQQPRLYFNDEKIEELSESIRQHGIIQPLTVIKQGTTIVTPEQLANLGAAVATVISLVWNFIGYKIFVFKK